MCDLAGPSAFRAALIRTAADRHRFVLTSHHIVVDGWSLPILLGEIFAGYYRQPLPPAVSYRRFVSWLAERDLDAARAAWGQVLAGFDTPTLVGPPGRVGLGARGVAAHQLSEQTTRALGELARARRTTVSTVLQAAFAQLLCGLTGQHDVVFGTAVSGRPAELAGAESMVGLVDQHRAGARDPDRYHHHHRAARAPASRDHHRTLEHQHLALTGDSPPHRVMTSCSTHLFVYENYPIDTAALASEHGLAITDFRTRESTHYPLTLVAGPGTELGLRVEYDTEVFDAAGIEALIERLDRVIVALTADPSRRLSTIDLLDTAEHARLQGWGNRAVLTAPAPLAMSIPVLFDAQVTRAPEAVAISCGDRSWRNCEVDEASNRLAHLLIARGVGPGAAGGACAAAFGRGGRGDAGGFEDRGGVCADRPGASRCADRVRAGRRRAVAALTTAGLADAAGRADELVVVDIDDPAIDSQPSTALPAPSPDDIAYLIYTSGTTGTPKGVAVAHRNVTRLLEALDAEVPAAGVWSQCHSLAFDFSVWEIFGALLGGGRLVVVPDAVVRSPEELHAVLVAEQVSVLSQTPSAFYALQAADALAPELGDQLKLETVVFGGEALEPQRLRAWLGRHPGLPRLLNMYGITETTVHASVREIVAADAEQHGQPDRGAVGPSWAFSCWTTGCVRCRPGWSGSCMWPAPVWPRGMWVGVR